MKTALELELEAVQLADRLDSGNPYLNRLYFLHFFSPMLEDDPTRWLSYRRQFISYLPHLCSGLNQCGWDPVDLERLLDIVRAFHGCCAEQETLVFDAEQQLRTACALHYLHVGEPERAAAVLGWPPPAETGADVYDRLLSVAPAEQSRDDLLAAAAAMRTALNAFRVGSLKVVLLAGQGEQTVGVLLPLHAQAKERPADAEEDRVLLNNTVPLQHGSLLWSLYDALAAARAAMSEPVAASYYSYQFSVADKEAELIGPSMSLAAAVCAWAAAGNRYYRLARYLFNQNAVVTGTIDADGCVKSVDEKGLAAKLRTVFFSPVERIFVPQDNLPFALRYLGELQKRYPKRQLSVQGIGTLEQALRDRNLVQTRPLTPTLRLISHTRRLKRKGLKSAVLAAFVFLLLLLSLDPFGWRQDRRPAAFDVLNSELIVKNAEGKLLWRHDFGSRLTRANYMEDAEYWTRILYDDLDNDGKSEVFMGLYEQTNDSLGGQIYCFSHDGRLRWVVRPFRVMRFGRLDYQDRYLTTNICVVKTRTGKRLAAIHIHNPFFPAPLTLISPQGKILGQFWHAGHYQGMTVHDIDHDGDDEILVGGCRNEDARAFLAVFEPDQVDGQSPGDPNGNYYSPDLPPTRARWYLRLPKTPFCIGNPHRDYPSYLVCTQEGIELWICNGFMEKVMGDLQFPWYYGVTTHFYNYHMELVRWFMADQTRYKLMQYRGRDLNAEETAALWVTDYWDGDKWVQTPTENKWFRLEAAN